MGSDCESRFFLVLIVSECRRETLNYCRLFTLASGHCSALMMPLCWVTQMVFKAFLLFLESFLHWTDLFLLKR